MRDKPTSEPTINLIGFGDPAFTFAVYIANQPNLPEYQSLSELNCLPKGEVARIGQTCGNGWRKVFNVYAKLLFALDKKYFSFAALAPTWQQFRDQYLLQAESRTALIFSPPDFSLLSNDTEVKILHIICGRTYAKQLVNNGLEVQLTWLDEEFAIDVTQSLIVCPYFDYRQLSNQKIKRLSVMLTELLIGRIEGVNE